MPKSFRLIFVASVLVIAGLVLLVGCSDDETEPETEAEATTTTTLSERAQEYADRIPELEQSVEENPEGLQTSQDLAVAYFQGRRYEEAVDTYERMLEIEDDAFTHNNLGNVYREMGNLEEAESQYETAIEMDPSLTVTYVNLAAMYERQERTDELRSLLERGVENTTGEDQERLKSLQESMLV